MRRLSGAAFFGALLMISYTSAQVETNWGCGATDYKCQLAGANRELKADPKKPEHHFNVGIVLQRSSAHQEAIASFDTVLAIPGVKGKLLGDAYNSRGYSYRALKQPQLALSDFDKAIASYPSVAIYHYNRGYAFFGPWKASRIFERL